MNTLSGKRMKMLDATLSMYSFMKKIDDEVVIKMSKDLFSSLVTFNCPYVIYSRDDFQPHQYKGYSLEIVSNLDYVAVAYFNKRTGKEHHIREIEEETT